MIESIRIKVKKLPFEEFKNIYSKVPRLCVDLLIKDKRGVLLTKRDIPPALGWWHLPGGTVLMKETLKEAVQRVAQEELNTKVTIREFITFLEYTEGSGFGYPISAIFMVEPKSKSLVGGKQARTIDYFNTLPEKTLPEVKRFLSNQFNL